MQAESLASFDFEGPPLSLDWELPDALGLSWKPSGDMKKSVKKNKYLVEVSKGSSNNFIPIENEITESSGRYCIEISNLEPSTSYQFRVIIKSKKGNRQGKILSVKTPKGVPGKPGQPVLSDATPNSLLVTFKTSKMKKFKVPKHKEKIEPVSYTLECDDNSEGKRWTISRTFPATEDYGENCQVTISDLQPGKQYLFRAFATNRFGNSKFSNVGLGITIGAPEQPEKPHAVEIKTTSVLLKWSQPKVIGHKFTKQKFDDISYTIEHDGASKVANWTIVSNSCTELQILATELKHNSNYLFRVSASNAQGSSVPSKSLKVTTLDGRPGAIHAASLLESTPTSLQLFFKLSKPINKEEEKVTYRVECDGSSKGKEWKEVTEPLRQVFQGGFDILVTNLTPSTPYMFRMIAQNIFGETFSKPISFTTTDGLPDRPNKMQCVGTSDTEAHMAWYDTVDRHKQQQQRMEDFLRPNFIIEYRMEDSETWTKVEVAKVDLLENGQYGATISNLSPKSTYEVRITAENEYGTSEAQVLKVKTKGPPKKPDHPVLRRTLKSSIEIFWNPKRKEMAEMEKPFILEWDSGTDANTWTAVGSEEILDEHEGKKVAIFKDLNSGHCYQFRLIASNKYGISEPSVPLIVKTISDSPQLQYATSNLINLIWNELMFDDAPKEKVKEYNIRYREKEEDTWKAAVVKHNKSEDDIVEGKIENLSPKTTYNICVVAVLKDGNLLTSKEISVKTLIEGISSQVIEPSVTRVDKTSCVVKWKALNDRKAKYKVEHDDGTRGTMWKDTNSEIIQTKKKFKAILDNLNPSTAYQVRVVAINEISEELPSKPVSFTTFAEDSPIDITLLRETSSRKLERMTFREDKKWFTARKQLPYFAWIELFCVLLSLLVAIAANASPFNLSDIFQGTQFSFNTVVQRLNVVEIIGCIIVFLVSCIRCHLYRIEKEVVRFIMVLFNVFSILVTIVALARSSPSTLLLAFYGVMLIREILHAAVDKSFYSKFHPMERKRVSNYTLTIALFVVCSGLVAIGILKLIFIGVKLPENFNGLF